MRQPVTRVWFNVASRVQPRRLIDCWNSNLQLVINTLLIAYWFPYSYSLLTHYSVFTTYYLLFTEYVRFGPLLTYSWYKSSSVIQQEHWCLVHWYSFLPGSSSWERLFVYIQTSDIRIRDILQNEKNFKSFLVSPGYVCKISLIYFAVARLHLSPLFEENLMTLWLGANSKHRTCWN